jgi:hypothetical protein
MARTTITLEDLDDGTLRLSLQSDPPLQQPFTDAQLFAIAAHAHLHRETGAPISVVVPVEMMIGDYPLLLLPSNRV